MSLLSKLKGYLPRFYDNVVEMQLVMESESSEFENIANSKESIRTEIYIDTATEYGLTRWENNILKIVPETGSSYTNRRGVIKGYLIGQNKLNATRIQELSDAFQNGKVKVELIDSEIKISFLEIFGSPDNYDEFYNSINVTKPAHLGLTIIIKIPTLADFDDYTLGELDNCTLGELEVYGPPKRA